MWREVSNTVLDPVLYLNNQCRCVIVKRIVNTSVPPFTQPVWDTCRQLFFPPQFRLCAVFDAQINLSTAGSFQKDAVSAAELMQPSNRNILTRWLNHLVKVKLGFCFINSQKEERSDRRKCCSEMLEVTEWFAAVSVDEKLLWFLVSEVHLESL